MNENATEKQVWKLAHVALQDDALSAWLDNFCGIYKCEQLLIKFDHKKLTKKQASALIGELLEGNHENFKKFIN